MEIPVEIFIDNRGHDRIIMGSNQSMVFFAFGLFEKRVVLSREVYLKREIECPRKVGIKIKKIKHF